MKYFFILGNHPSLSVAEIISKTSPSKEEVLDLSWQSQDIFIMETDEKYDPKKLIKEMGGTIKIGKIIKEAEKDALLKELLLLLEKNKKNSKKNSFNFGISFYGKSFFDTKKIAMEVKNKAREIGINCKWVGGKDKILSSVSVEKNDLLKNGIEIILIEKKDKTYLLGETLSVQPFEELSKRDYGRPARDDFSGMLPPKLAQIMINLAKIKNENSLVLDPFCGSGTILTESLLMGYNNIFGTDISPKAILDTKKNIRWTVENFHIAPFKCKIIQKDAGEISSIISNKIDAIITEPFLGPQRKKELSPKEIRGLEKLYTRTLSEFQKILHPNGVAVMIWPIFVEKKKTFHQNLKFIYPKLDKLEIISPLPKDLALNPFAKITKRNTLIYGRKGQKVWREIVVLKLK